MIRSFVPGDLYLLFQPRGDGQKTKEVLASELQAKFSQGVQKHPFAAWKSFLKGVRGKMPLSITMLSAVHCEVYWDVSSGEKARLLKALRGGGFLIDSVLTSTDFRFRRRFRFLLEPREIGMCLSLSDKDEVF